MSRIWNGIEIVAEFKLQGIGPDNFMVFQVNKCLFKNNSN